MNIKAKCVLRLEESCIFSNIQDFLFPFFNLNLKKKNHVFFRTHIRFQFLLGFLLDFCIFWDVAASFSMFNELREITKT